MRDFEEYLKSATPFTAKEACIEIPPIRQASGPDSVFYGLLDNTAWAGQVACVYSDVAVPDVISKIDNGLCWACEKTRFICPGCAGGKPRKFCVSMGCDVDLACPRCMGYDFSQRHKYFLEMYYNGKAPEDEEEEMEELIQE